jgi:ABC-type glycerol-3-phosphate transport system permease component
MAVRQEKVAMACHSKAAHRTEVADMLYAMMMANRVMSNSNRASHVAVVIVVALAVVSVAHVVVHSFREAIVVRDHRSDHIVVHHHTSNRIRTTMVALNFNRVHHRRVAVATDVAATEVHVVHHHKYKTIKCLTNSNNRVAIQILDHVVAASEVASVVVIVVAFVVAHHNAVASAAVVVHDQTKITHSTETVNKKAAMRYNKNTSKTQAAFKKV